MKKGIAVLLVLVMAIGTIATSIGSVGLDGTTDGDRTDAQAGASFQSSVISPNDANDPVMDYLRGLDPAGPRVPTGTGPGESQPGEGSHPFPPLFLRTDAVLLYMDPDKDEWFPLPTRDELNTGNVDPVTFNNGSMVEIHGKLYEEYHGENTTFYDDIGLNDMQINITFDGEPIPGGEIVTGNNTTVIDPFVGTGNGTFLFNLDINKPAGEYEIVLDFAGWPSTGTMIYRPLTRRTIVYVNHPTIIDLDVAPDPVVVGTVVNINGSLVDDTGRPISNSPLQVWFDDELLGPTSDGVYIDDFEVKGVYFSDGFDTGTENGWSTFSAPNSPSGNQWQIGPPHDDVGPTRPHFGSYMWGTNLDGDYQRGAWCFLVSPAIDLSVDRSYTLSFWAWWKVYWDDDLAYVLASEDGGVTWDESNAMTFMGSALVQAEWTQYEFNVTRYKGSEDVRFAFVFYSADKTLDVGADAIFGFRHKVPLSEEADRHRVTVVSKGSLLFHEAQAFEDIDVKRMTHFEVETNETLKIGYRGQPIALKARLVDNMGEVLSTSIRGMPYVYQVSIFWDSTWTIEDGIGEYVEPMGPMDGVTGELYGIHIVDRDQYLGPVRITFKFPGATYYAGSEGVDVYKVRAHTYFLLPPEDERVMFRGQTVDIQAELRTIPEESSDPTEPGDPLSGQFIKVYWEGEVRGNRRTDSQGIFTISYLVPSTQPFGLVEITYMFEGSTLYEPVTTKVNYTVMDRTFITLEDAQVFKGDWTWINGSIKDDKGQPLPDLPIYILWKRAPEIGRATTDENGNFSLQYYIEYEDKVGNVTVIARFKGNTLYHSTETTATYTVWGRSTLLRTDDTRTAVRGQEVEITAKLKGDWWGGYSGSEIDRQLVTLTIDGIMIDNKHTRFDGTVTFTANLTTHIFRVGEVDVVLEYQGDGFYLPSMNVTTLVIMVNANVTLSAFEVNGRPFNASKDYVRKDETIWGRILIQEVGYAPLADWNVSVYYKDEGQRARLRLIEFGRTDAQGNFDFCWTFRVWTLGYKRVLVECEGLPDGIIEIIEFTYIVPPDSVSSKLVDPLGDRQVVVGDALELVLRVRSPEDWNMDGLTFSLIDPPDGMTITPDGTITWTPTEDQVGRHDVQVWLFDGQRSESTDIDINVVNEGTDLKGLIYPLIGLLIASLVVVVLVILYFRSARKGE